MRIVMGIGLLVFLLPACRLVHAQERLDLPSAISCALEQNRELARSALSMERSRWSLRAARADFGLRVRPNSNVGFSSEREDWEYGFALGRRFGLGTALDVGSRISSTQPEDEDDVQRTTVAVQLSQPIFRNFGALVNEEGMVQAKSRLKETRRAYQQQQADLVLEVVESFEAILQFREQRGADESFFERADRLYRLTRARERQGRASRVDALRAELQRGDAESRLESTRELLASTEQDFAELLGFAPLTTFRLEPPPVLDLSFPAAQEAVRIALANRLDYAQVLQDLDDESRGVRIARRRFAPDLSLVSRWERFGEGEQLSDSYDLDEDEWFVGVTAETDFNPGRERAGVREALVDREASERAVEISELTIAREVQQEIASYRRAQAELKIAGRNLRLARDRARLARRLFEIGRGDAFSATDAEEAYVRSQNELLRKRAEAAVAGYRLKHTMGTLIEYSEDLKPTSGPEPS